MNKNIELNILKVARKSLYDERFPKYLKVNLHRVESVLIPEDLRLRLSFLFRENQEHFSTRQQLFLTKSL